MTPLPVLHSRRRQILADLQRLDVGDVRFDRHDRLLYATDASLYQVEPIGVVVPASVEQAKRIIDYCARGEIALLPRGGGTSLAGQCTNHALVLDLSPNFRRILSVDPVNRLCHVEPGVTVDELNRVLADRAGSLFFAPDPATSAQACIGGCIGNNAAGARSIRYGRTSENVAGVEVLLSGGQRLWLESGAGGRNSAAAELARQVAAVVQPLADEIRRRFPKLIRRNAGYGLDLILNQLDRGMSANDLDLSGLICGSEGTLALVVSAKLKLHPVPRARGLAIASFSSLETAIDAVPALVASGPTAVELLDDVVLDAARGNLRCRAYVDLLPLIAGRPPAAALYVEYQADDSPAQLDAAFDSLHAILRGVPIAVYRDAGAMGDAWTLRKSGEALLHNLSATRKPVTFVEDNAVPVEQLGRFVREFKRIVAGHGATAAYWAHASVGVLHVRPMLDLHDPADLAKMRAIAAEVADLARECGGVMSGEHGDGRARGPLLERFFSRPIVEAFARIKQIFDPAGVFNPGDVVNPGPVTSITEHLRVQAEAAGPDLSRIQTYFDYSDQENFGSAIERCNGAGFCRKTMGGMMCPSYRATLEERHGTRGRGNALRLAITGQAVADNNSQPAWDDPETMATLDLCLGCKACKTECPSNVDIGRLKAEYTAQRFRSLGKTPLQARIFGHVRLLNRLGALAPGLANAMGRSRPVRALADRILGFAPQRTLPPFAPSLHRWFAKRRRGVIAAGPRVLLFADCFRTYSEPHIGVAAIAALESLGYTVELPRAACCGRAMISAGLLDDAARSIERALAVLGPAGVDENVKAIVVCEPSCLSAIKDEWLQLRLPTDLAIRRQVAAKAMLVEEFIERFWSAHPIAPAERGHGGPPVLFHGHCHQKSLWGEQTSTAILRRLLGDRLQVIPSGCCGMAGAFGYAADHYDISMRIGELSLFPPLRAAPIDAMVLAPGTSCRHQIRDGAARTARHPIELIARLLRTEKP